MQPVPLSPGATGPRYVIRATPNVFALEPAVLWEYRALVWLLVLRDFRIKYRQSVFGACWLLLHPFGSVCLYSFIFGKLARMPSDNVPFALFNYVGLLPWMFFSASLPAVTQCLLANGQLLQKVYFPRILLPLQVMVSALIDFLILLVIQIGVLCLYGYVPGWNVIWLPLFAGWAMLTSLAVGLGLASLHVRFRDVGFGLSYLIQLWFFATPIAYSTGVLPPWLQRLSALNPLTWVVNGFRWALLGTATPPRTELLGALAITLVVLGLSYLWFRRTEANLVDVI